MFYVGTRGTQTLAMIEGGATAPSRFFTYLRDPVDTLPQEQSTHRSIFPVQAAITSRSTNAAGSRYGHGACNRGEIFCVVPSIINLFEV